MERHIIGVRLHDVNQGLLVVTSGLVDRYYRTTKLMGAVAQVSGLIVGQQQISTNKLLVAAGELARDDSLLERVHFVLK